MKKSLLLTVSLLLLLVGGYMSLDAYLCSHLYYGWGPFSTCVGGQGKGLNILGRRDNWSVVLWGLVSSVIPVLYLIFSRKVHIRSLLLWFIVGAASYIVGFSVLKDALIGQGVIILLFNIAIIFIILITFLLAIAVLGNRLFHILKWHIGKSMHDVFLQFTVGLIVFCMGNVFLILGRIYYGVVIRLQIAGMIYLLWKYKSVVSGVIHSVQQFVQNIHSTLSSTPSMKILYYIIIIVACLYIYMGLNLAYIPYPTAWDANHAYIFFPRAWAIHNGFYWGTTGATSTPFLWYGFLTFWYKFALSFPIGSGVFGIGPDSLTILMNFWSGPLVFLASGFLLHAFIEYIKPKDSKHNDQNVLAVVFIGLLLVLLWLTSGMGAFLVFVDNKTDLAVMFLGVLALYVGIQFIHLVHSKHHTNEITDKKHITQFAIIAGFLFAASALAKPTGLFDIVHFAILFLLSRHWGLLAIGAYSIILGGLGLSKLLLVTQFITTTQSYRLIGIGCIIFIIALFPVIKKGTYRLYIRYFLIWILSTITTIIIYKGPYSIIQQILTKGFVTIPETIRVIILGNNISDKHILLASTVSMDTLSSADTGTSTSQQIVSAPNLSLGQCIATKPQDTSILYSSLKSVPTDGSNEDLGRYIGYGQKSFKNIWLLSWLPNGCYSIYTDARALCGKLDSPEDLTKDSIIALLSTVPQTSNVIEWIHSLQSASDSITQNKIIKQISTYVDSNTIVVGPGIKIPYKYLVPFNVTFNWSLQNLSSYYTDIGIIWLLALGLVIIGLLYGLVIHRKILVNVSLITLGAWAIWWVVGSSIIWYSLGLILRTILGITAYIYYLFEEHDTKKEYDYVVFYGIIGLFLTWSCIQLLLNIVRIASQGNGGPFAWYKTNVGQTYVVNEQLQGDTVNKVGFGAQDVLDMQFPHYNGIIKMIDARNNGEGVIIAGTYLQYFIKNQNNVEADGFLSNFWTTISDNNVCNTYLRLKDKNTKYIVIDPNIASVVMGEGNNTLLDRFLAIIGPNNTILQHGTLTMLQALKQQGYLSFAFSNNLVTKYAFVAPDEQLSPLIGGMTGEALLIERAKMSAARFFPKSQDYANAALQIFVSRINNLDAIQDIADVMGKQIRIDTLLPLVKSIAGGIKQDSYNDVGSKIKDLTSDERFVLQQFLSMKQAQTENPQQFRQFITGILTQSVNNGSQLIVLTVE